MKMHLVKLRNTFLLILFFALHAAAQSPAECAASAPRLLGLSLGMSATEARSVFGSDLKVKVKSSGDRGFFQNYIKKPATGKLSGVRALYLRFLDGSLYQIEIFYEPRADSPTLEAFTAALNFPENFKWRFANNRARVDCGAFTIVADKPVDARIELTDTAKLAEAEARRGKK